MNPSFSDLAERPFPATPEAECYFPAASIDEARARLTRAIERAEGPGLLIGAAGTGKSLLCQVLAKQLSGEFVVATLNSARLCTRRALLQAILFELGQPYRDREEGELRLSLIDFLDALPAPKQAMLLLIDEAHAMPMRLIEEIRLITNLVRSGVPRVRLILAGAPSLEERLAHPKLDSLNQRIAARCYLSPLEATETAQYVLSHLARSGDGAAKLVTEDGLEAVHHASGGVPRLINQVCDHALLLACAAGSRKINAQVIEEAWSDLQRLPVPWPTHGGASGRGANLGVVEFGSLDDDEPQTAPSRVARDYDDADDEVAAVPFSPFRSPDPARRIDALQRQLAGLDDEPAEFDFEPLGVIGTEVELVFPGVDNPFQEDFDTEEVVIDRYASLDDSLLRNCPRVTSRKAEDFSPLMNVPPAAPSLEVVRPAPTPTVGPVVPESPPVAQSGPARTSPAPFPAPAAPAAPAVFETPAAPVTPIAPTRVAEVRASVPIYEAPRAIDPVFPEAWDPSEASDVPARVATLSSTGDLDLIIVEEDDEPGVVPVVQSPRVERREYRQLFSRLRQG